MSVSLSRLHDRISVLEQNEAAAELRIKAQDAKLAAVQQERDDAVASLATTTDNLTALQEQMANSSGNTAAFESAVAAEIERVDAVSTRLADLDAKPVPATPASAPTGDAEAAPDAAPAPDAGASADAP